MTTFRFGGHRVNRLMALCSDCRRNYHKVVVRHADGSLEGFCPSCWQRNGQYSIRVRLAGTGAVIAHDMRKRHPEWTPERADTVKALRENIASLEKLTGEDPFADVNLLASNRRMLSAMLSEIETADLPGGNPLVA